MFIVDYRYKVGFKPLCYSHTALSLMEKYLRKYLKKYSIFYKMKKKTCLLYSKLEKHTQKTQKLPT